MVTINYQTFGSGFYLRLRVYLNGETKYVNVTKLLKGSLQKRHWNQKKQRFIPSAPESEENNRVLSTFRKPYDDLALTWRGTLFGFMQTIGQNGCDDEDEKTLKGWFEYLVGEYKKTVNSDGTIPGTYKAYSNCSVKLGWFCDERKIDYDTLLIKDIKKPFVEDFINSLEGERKNATSTIAILHSALVKAGKKGLIDFSELKDCKWIQRRDISVKKYESLTAEQCRMFANMPLDELPPATGNRRQLYRDFCLFILYTCQSPCDAICMKYDNISNINGIDHLMFKRRKIARKQKVECSVPVNPVMKEIMDRWKPYSKDGYIFPVRNNETARKCSESNLDIRSFIVAANLWLRKLGDKLGLDFRLHLYAFRHTAITQYISKGVSAVYIANMAGTSVDNIEKIYYNNHGDMANRNKVLSAVEF